MCKHSAFKSGLTKQKRLGPKPKPLKIESSLWILLQNVVGQAGAGGQLANRSRCEIVHGVAGSKRLAWIRRAGRSTASGATAQIRLDVGDSRGHSGIGLGFQ